MKPKGRTGPNENSGGSRRGGSRKSKVIFSPNLFLETKTYLKIFSKNPHFLDVPMV